MHQHPTTTGHTAAALHTGRFMGYFGWYFYRFPAKEQVVR